MEVLGEGRFDSHSLAEDSGVTVLPIPGGLNANDPEVTSEGGSRPILDVTLLFLETEPDLDPQGWCSVHSPSSIGGLV